MNVQALDIHGVVTIHYLSICVCQFTGTSRHTTYRSVFTFTRQNDGQKCMKYVGPFRYVLLREHTHRLCQSKNSVHWDYVISSSSSYWNTPIQGVVNPVAMHCLMNLPSPHAHTSSHIPTGTHHFLTLLYTPRWPSPLPSTCLLVQAVRRLLTTSWWPMWGWCLWTSSQMYLGRWKLNGIMPSLSGQSMEHVCAMVMPVCAAKHQGRLLILIRYVYR